PRAGGPNGNRPLITGYVPVELVVIVEETQCVGDDVLDVDGLNGIVGIRNVDLEFAVVTVTGRLVSERPPIGVSDFLDGKEKRVVEALRRDVFDRNGSVEPMPADAIEMGLDGLGDVYRRIGMYDNIGVEVIDNELLTGDRGRWKSEYN